MTEDKPTRRIFMPRWRVEEKCFPAIREEPARPEPAKAPQPPAEPELGDDVIEWHLLHDALECGLWDLPPLPPREVIIRAIKDKKNIFGKNPRNWKVQDLGLVQIEHGDNKLTAIIAARSLLKDKTYRKASKYVLDMLVNEMRKHFHTITDDIDISKSDLSFFSNELGFLENPISKNSDFFRHVFKHIPKNMMIKAYLRGKTFNIYMKDNYININLYSALPPVFSHEKYDYFVFFGKEITLPDLPKEPAPVKAPPAPPAPVKAPEAPAFDGSPLSLLLHADNLRARLPVLDARMATDPDLGLWDLWWPEDSEPDPQWHAPLDLEGDPVAADPWKAVQRDDRHGTEAAVAIDFGTSATVAAIREMDGGIRLLRLGGDLSDLGGASHTENPTALLLSDVESLEKAWRREPWRPLVGWRDLRCGHQARSEMADSPERIGCGMGDIKTWARGGDAHRLRDAAGRERILEPLPVAADDGDGIGDFSGRPLDPLELYAFLMGVRLNTQAVLGGRIYLNYAMTFPTAFEAETRARILRGFRRGLLRSLPASLAASRRWKEEGAPLVLDVRGDEPTALAACLLPRLGIRPSKEGVPFAVFDFGGGTADFAFGLWRAATTEEAEDEEWGRVLEMRRIAGDADLGGERILDLLAWEVIRANAEALRRAGIPFLLPRGQALFPGSELLFGPGHVERTNTALLREALRPLWEEGALPDNDTGILALRLTRRDGAPAETPLKADADALRRTARNRVAAGVRDFLAILPTVFSDTADREIHILMAGNSCRSPLTRDVLAEALAALPPEEAARIRPHDEIIRERRPADAPDDAPTPKTCVALGLLRILRGSSTGVVAARTGGEAPFRFSVGRVDAEEDVLLPLLTPENASYAPDAWIPWGRKVNRDLVTRWAWSDSALAAAGGFPASRCHPGVIRWNAEDVGRRILVRAAGPARLEFGLGPEERRGAPAFLRVAADGEPEPRSRTDAPDPATIRAIDLD